MKKLIVLGMIMLMLVKTTGTFSEQCFCAYDNQTNNDRLSDCCSTCNNITDLWKYNASDSKSYFVYDNDKLFITDNNKIVCLNIETGKILNSFVYNKRSDSWLNEIVNVQILNNLIIVNMNTSDGTILFSIDYKKCSVLWTKTFDTKMGQFNTSSEGLIFIAEDDLFSNKTLYCINAFNGSYIWRYIGYSLHCKPVIFDNYVYIGDVFDIIAIERYSGKKSWEKSIGSEVSNIVYNNDKLFITSGSEITCLNANNGDYLWSDYNNMASTKPIVDTDNVSVGEYNGIIHNYNIDNGSENWSYDSFEDHGWTMTLSNSLLYVFDFDNVWKGGKSIRCMSVKKSNVFWTIKRGYDRKPILANRKLILINGKNISCIGNPSVINMILKSKQCSFGQVTKSLDKEVFLYNSTPYCPAKNIIEILGGAYTNKNSQGYYKLSLRNKIVEFKTGSPTIKVNGIEQKIDAKNIKITPIVLSETQMIPISYIMTLLDCFVKYDSKTGSIQLSYYQ